MTHPTSFDPTLITGDSFFQLTGAILFALAVLHTFLVKRFENIAHHFPKGSMGENFFHFMGEVEAVMGMWAAVLIAFIAGRVGLDQGIAYLESLNFTEPAFVFVIMCIAGTRPVIKLAELLIRTFSKILPFPRRMAFYFSTLVIGPLMGSFITEPAAMTVTALILLEAFYKRSMSQRFMYATLGLLFVNVSIGGTLTHFAAPPVLMVAGKWGWGMMHMLSHFGYKAAFAVALSTLGVTLLFAKELKGELQLKPDGQAEMSVPWWMMLMHCLFLFLVVRSAHHMVFFFGIFLMFLGFAKVTQEFQDPLKLRESLLVGFFLGGLVILGSLQNWWLEPLLGKMNELTLFVGATLLTAVTDNAALTYLGSLVQGLPETSKYFLVAGAVTGGGLTVIANAPNPAGYGILKDSFGDTGISPLGLLGAALGPTVVAFLAFLLLPNLS
jgi:hypothetical protein